MNRKLSLHKEICLEIIDCLQNLDTECVYHDFFNQYRLERALSASFVERIKRELIRQKVLSKSRNCYLVLLDNTEQARKSIVRISESAESIQVDATTRFEKYEIVSRSIIEKELSEYSIVQIDTLIDVLLEKNILKKLQGDKGRSKYIMGDRNLSDLEMKDPLQLISTLSQNITFCYHSALMIHGLSRYAVTSEYYVHGNISRLRSYLKNISVKNVKLQVPDLGILKMPWKNIEINVTSIERTMIDCIHKPSYAAGWENVVHALRSVEPLDEQKTLDILKSLSKPILFAKVGYTLENFQDNWNISQNTINTLKLYVSRTPVRFFREYPGKLNSNWNLFVPEDLFLE
jgi:predicted transcriptional regulator of viral defense system